MSKTFVAAVAFIASLQAVSGLELSASDFAQDDCIVILVSGDPAVSTPWGLSGRASLHRATQTTVKGKLGFSPVDGATNITCERRSARKVDNPFDYSENGQIPPGIYFVSYHRLDDDAKRHRLSIGDELNSVNIITGTGDAKVKRVGIQFHQAANDLARYTPRLSEGCIIFTGANFSKLFPGNFLDPATSPLHASTENRESAKAFVGKGRVLVFVTDVTDAERNEYQLKVFDSVVQGGEHGLTVDAFQTDSDVLKTLRIKWSDG